MTLNSDTNTLKRKRNRKLKLWLINDSVNTIEHVCQAIQTTVPGYNVLRAEQVAMIAHYKGKAELCTMPAPDIRLIQAQLMQYGLSVRLTLK